MRRLKVLGSALGVLAVGGACATSPSGTGSSRFSQSPQVTRMSRAQQVAWRDSVYAQAIADAEGPGARISAQVSSLAGSRRVRAVFSLDADAYVIIGHIDPEGVLRIAFPGDPSTDDGFVRGGKTYQTQEFFAGFNDQYRFRAATNYYRMSPIPRADSYDGGLGYLFIIATWRPMRFDRFRTENKWDTFELADDEYLRDPRPAIYELAALLAGENRETYTVKFARYTTTQSVYAGYSSFSSAYGAMNYCAGYRPFGFAFDPFANPFPSGFAFANAYGYSFSRRGVDYLYDAAFDCYRTRNSGSYYGGPRIAGPIYNPGVVDPRKRALDPEGYRSPMNPRVVGAKSMPSGRAVDAPSGDIPVASPSYRQRGLITSDEEGGRVGVPGRREPRTEARVGQERTRPSIQEMVQRQPTSPTRGDGQAWARAQAPERSSHNPAPRDREPVYSAPRSAPADMGSRGVSSGGYSGSSGTAVSAPPPAASAPPASQSSGPAGSSSSTGTGRPGTP